MKKIFIILAFFIVISFLILVFVFSIFIGNFESNELQIERTFMKDSTELVAELEIFSDINQNQKLTFNTSLEEANTISFQNVKTSRGIEVLITNVEGKEVFAEKIKENETVNFESISGKGEIQLILNRGLHEVKIEINGSEHKNE